MIPFPCGAIDKFSAFIELIAKMGIKRLLQKGVNMLGYRVVSNNDQSLTKAKYYIDCQETVATARAEGLSVCDYVEKLWDQQGATTNIITQMQSYGCFEHLVNVCEIGPGTGRYLEKVIEQNASIKSYVIYEVAKDWAEWLQQTYPVVSREADGYSLKFEEDASMDLVHAHGVFVYLNFIHCMRYIKEMIRITKPGGYIVFDFYPAEMFDTNLITKWIDSSQSYPVILPENVIIAFLKDNGVAFCGSFQSKHGQGVSCYHVYKKG
jgi:SAM-dependent methyltransferase